MVKSVERIRDPIHDLIEFRMNESKSITKTCWSLLQTRPMQRLRRIKQLGFSELIYPGATHSRLAHSIGVFHTARQLVEVLEWKNTNHDDRRRDAAIAAALLHDLGHGPFSHAFENALKELNMKSRHEERSVEIIRQTEIKDILDDLRDKNFSNEVAQIIGSEHPADMYASVVSSQFDADRLDYMRRDRYMTGSQHAAIDFRWLLANLEVRRVPLGQEEQALGGIDTLVVGPKAIMAAEAYVLGLFHLYPTIYYHKTTRSVEKIFSELLIRTGRLFQDGHWGKIGLPKNHPIFKFFDKPSDIEAFLLLDDHVIWSSFSLMIEASDPILREFTERILYRRLYKAVDVTGLLSKEITSDDKEEKREKIKQEEARIRQSIQDSGLLSCNQDVAPLALEDTVKRNPYKRGEGGTSGLDAIRVIDSDEQLKDIREVSDVVGGLDSFNRYRIYYRNDDAKEKIEKIINRRAA